MAARRIPEKDIAEIRERTAIEEIVSEYVQLKPAGADSLKGLSPFKDERTPSFHVRPQRGFFHCFSTGKGGDVFTFLMEVEHVTFPEAVEICADKIGYHINYEGGGTSTRTEPGTRKRLIEANKLAHEFYQEHLITAEAAVGREFLAQRGFGRADAETFGCGYAPDGWDTLTKHLLGRGFSAKELIDAGLTSQGRRGPIDRFHRRLLWPIKSVTGEVIGFGARKLFDDDKLGKYINTSETMLYKKSKVLFGLDLAKHAIAEHHRAVIVEGYTDVMAMHAAGVTETVAACGTAFGDEHLHLLRRFLTEDSFFHGEVIYTFDGDEAGQKAALRVANGDQQYMSASFVCVAPDGLDPCDLRLQHGNKALAELVATRLPMVEFVVRTLLSGYDLSSANGRHQALQRVAPHIARVDDAMLRKNYARDAAGWIGWSDEREVVDLIERLHKQPPKQQHSKRQQIVVPSGGTQESSLRLPDRRSRRLYPERETIKLALQYPQLLGQSFDQTVDELFTDPTYQRIAGAIRSTGSLTTVKPGATWLSEVADNVGDFAGASLVSELAMEEIRCDEDALGAYARSILASLVDAFIGNMIAQLKGQLQRMRRDSDPAAYDELFSRIIALETQRKANKKTISGV
ncbi:DNA primase [Corynebacterium choanae]|uniref:DNA primase n=1 Tax=Corynebacterium choanae TaxID=1862358 RepID=A0A3G6J7S9_9CORY|nr:DNA primase [Corynebacterium choanae]AZA14046.1 DNA primase [Corynebacterium choanae]